VAALDIDDRENDRQRARSSFHKSADKLPALPGRPVAPFTGVQKDDTEGAKWWQMYKREHALHPRTGTVSFS
jgi:hypothetical protein